MKTCVAVAYIPPEVRLPKLVYLATPEIFPRITARTLSTWSSFVDVEGRPGLRSSPSDILPSLERLNHS